MGNTCTFILCEGDSPSGDYAWWEIEGIKECVEDPNRYAKDAMPNDRYWRVTIKPGQHLFLHERYEEDEETIEMATLIRVPIEPALFEAFKQKAKIGADQIVYDRILGYKRGPRYGGGPYDYTNDFGGEWLREFTVRSWRQGESRLFPTNLVEALHPLAL